MVSKLTSNDANLTHLASKKPGMKKMSHRVGKNTDKK